MLFSSNDGLWASLVGIDGRTTGTHKALLASSIREAFMLVG